MQPELAIQLARLLGEYVGLETLREFADLFGVTLERPFADDPKWLPIARELVEQLDHGNNRRLVDALLDHAEHQNDDMITHATYERQTYHQGLRPIVAQARAFLSTSAAPSEIVVPSGSVFTAKSKVREHLETATTPLFIVDPYIGVGTLDCIRGIRQPIRLLTGAHGQAIEPSFDRALADYSAEGHEIEIRRAAQLHDRHLVFNGRCWLVGSSLKDAGKKAFNCLEMVDHVGLVGELEAKWQAAPKYP